MIRRTFRIDGGAEVATNNVISSLISEGYVVTLFCEGWSGSLPSEVRIVSCRTFGPRFLKLLQFTWAARAFLKRNEFERIQSHEWIPGAPVLRLGDGLHSFWLTSRCKDFGWLRRLALRLSLFHGLKLILERMSLNHAGLRKIIVNSIFVKQQVSARYPRVSNLITVERNVLKDGFMLSTTPKIQKAASLEVKLLFVGSGWERKGLIHLLNAMRMLPENYNLDIFGEDKNSRRYKKWVKDRTLDSRVKFKGVCGLTSELYRQYSMLVLPTQYDPFPNVICEALCSGIPVISTPVSGCVDFESHDAVKICRDLTKLDLSIMEVVEADPEVDADFFQRLFTK